VYIHPTAQIRKSKIGPHVSVGSGCRVEDSQIDNSIIETGAVINSSRLSGALVGERAQIKGVNGAVIVGDDSLVKSSS
jgi:glucose-1-phosphate thymidylyltransferase